MLRASLWLTLAFGLTGPVRLSAAEPPPEAVGQDVDIARALRSREYDRAARLIDQALASPDTPGREFLRYRRGLAALYGGQPTEALAQFDEQLEEFPGGPWARKARFRQADAYVALRRFEEAERIYSQCVRALVGEGRKAEIARVYLEFAEEYFTPADTLTKPDYRRARTFYERALELEPGPALRDELLYKQALCNQKLESWGDAAGQYEQYLTIFDADYRVLRKQRRGIVALPAAASEPGGHIVAARLGLARCRRAMNDLLEARRTCQDLRSLLDKIDPDREREREAWIQATYLLAQTYGMPQPADGEALALGVQTLEELLKAFPGSEQAIRAAHDIGAARAHLGRSDDAIAALRALIDREVIRPNTDETRKLAEQLSQDALFRIGQLHFGQKKYADAIGVWNQYVAKYPTGPHWSAAQQAIVDAEYQIGADAAADKRYDAAREAWTGFLQKYPLDGRAPQIMFAFGSMAYAQQGQRQEAGQEPDWNQPLTHWRRLVNKFPGTEIAGEAQFEIGRILEDKLQDLEAAIEAYRKLNWSAWSARAQERIAEMQATQLLVRTERSFRTDQPATVRVDLRNIEKLTVKLYRIDMQDYFRKSHTLGGVERLDLLLIDPDQTLEVAVTDYAAYKPITQEIEIPFDGPGVYAVNVSNETSEAEPPAGGPIRRVEATTLVIRSDIDIVIKSSRRQALVFAQDMRTQEPAAGVNILVSDGGKIRFDGSTGEDGVWLVKSKDLKDLGRLSVLAQRDGHVAGNALSLEGLEFSTGLQPRGYIYTDRPVYRPDEAVNIRGILREVTDGQYVLPAQPEDQRLAWKLDVLDSKGRVLRTESLTLSEFGSFATQFQIAADAPVGQYRLIARRPEGPTFTGGFQVQKYELPKAVLKFEFDEPVVMRGEKITGHIVVTYTYGEPVAGKTVEYGMQLWTDEMVNRTGVTDDSGKIAFEFDSTLFPEEGVVYFGAMQADLELEAVDTLFIAVRAFRAAVKTVRREAVFLAEEPIEVTVETKDLKGEPVGREMTLTALRRTYDRSRWTETKVETVEVETDGQTGVGRATLRLVEGGNYVLRASGVDRFDHRVFAETYIRVSDDEDRTRIRLFSDRQHYKVGETIALKIHSRLSTAESHGATEPRSREDQNPERERRAAEEPRASARAASRTPDAPATSSSRGFLALMTYEGEEIIGYRTLRIRPGHNPLEIPVENAHFPNFAVGVAVMEPGRQAQPGRLHTAAREFTVERQLNITLKPSQKTYRPREELELEVTVTDQQGRPVEAEVGVAMIDSALLSRYPDPTPHIVAFFQEGAYRQARLRTETSCTFRYISRTRAMVSELLAEARRMDEQGERFARADTTAYSVAVRRIQLEHADAKSVAEALRTVFHADGRGVRGRGVATRVQITADERTNSLIVVGDADAEAIEEFVQQLDQTAALEVNRPIQIMLGVPMSEAQAEFELGRMQSRDSYPGRRSRRPIATRGTLDPGQALNRLRARLGARRGGQQRQAGEGGARGGQLFQSNAQRDEDLFDFRRYAHLSYGYQIPADEKYTAPIFAQRRLRSKAREFTVLLANLSSAEASRLVAGFNAFLRSAPPRSYFPEVAYWNPRVTTDADGKATVKIIVPDSSTTWKFVARGATPETLVGRGEAEVLSKHDFFVELSTPPTLIEGDTFQPRATVHCLAEYVGEVGVTLRVKGRRHPGTEAPRPEGPEGRKEGEEPRASARAAAPDATAPQTRTIKVDGTGTFEVVFDAIPVGEAGMVEFEVTAATAEDGPDARSDMLVREVPIRPWGMPIEAHAAGVGRDSDFVEIELPPAAGPQRAYHDLQLTVAVGPGMQRWLVEEALESGPRWRFIEHQLAARRIAPPRTHADTASSLLGCLYAADYLRAQEGTEGRESSADARRLDERIAGLIAQLLAAQDDSGGWSWCGQQPGSNPWTTAQIAWALGKAREDGYPVADAAAERAVNYLRKVFADADPSQNELKANVLHGLSWLDKVDFAHVNRLHRSREVLSNAALGHLALTFIRLDRKSAAAEVLSVLRRRVRERGGARPVGWLSSKDNSAWMNSELEVTALALLAQLSVDPREATVPKLVAYLVGAARADGWRPHKARGTVLAALATYYARGEQQAANYRLAVSVNGRELRQLTSDDTGSVRIDLSEDELRPGKQRIDFAFQGRGEYAYAVTLHGFSPGFPNPDDLPRDVLRTYRRQVMPPPLEYRGRVVAAGFEIARDYKHFRNHARHLPVGKVASVQVSLRRYDRSENRAGDRDYVIVKETIPAGFRLLEETLQGRFLAHDYTDNVLTLYYGSRRSLGGLSYRMVATTPGEYRLPPTIIRSLYRPDLVHVNKADQRLTVLTRGTQSPDEYRMTPDELYHLGRLHFDDGEYAAATKHLEELLAGRWLLHAEPYREAVRLLLNAALARDDADAIVNYFEILKEKYPDLVIPFEQIVQVADAYARTGQHERAYLVYRATADASFVRDAAVGGTLQDEGRFLESIDFLEDLWRAYPDTPQVESTYYALAQTLYAQADKADQIRPRRTPNAAAGAPAGRPRNYVTRAEIIREAITLLERFLALYPESPVADEAGYSLATAHLDLDDHWTAINRARELIDRFADSKWLDRFRYIEALALFHLGEFDRARGVAELVSVSTYKDERGVERPSPNKWLALYIIGQIYHAQNRTSEAIEFYEKVRDRFSDADEAVSYFEHKYVSLPEVTIFHPDGEGFREAEEWAEHLRSAKKTSEPPSTLVGAPALVASPSVASSRYEKPFIQIDYRNISSAVLQVYRVDLLKLALIEKNLTEITAVNLAGISPTLERTVSLGDGRDYVDKSLRVELDLLSDADDRDAATGAYLVICRGDDLFTSGLVLVTPLAIEVQEDVAAQRTRVNVVNAITRRGLSDVHVKVIGMQMDRFVSGETDLRGVYAADGVTGYPTAVARDADGHFAFYRSEGALLAMARPEPTARPAEQAKKPATKADYFQNLSQEQQEIQADNRRRLKGMFQTQQRGVEVKKSH